MKRSLFSMLLMVVASVMFVSCDKKMKELKEQVDRFNKVCPINYGDLMTLNSVMLDGDVVEMKVIADETAASISALNNHKDEAKEIMTMSLSKETSKVLVDKIIDSGAILKTVIIGGQSDMRVELELPASELQKAKQKFSNMTEEQKLIASNVLGAKIRLPQVIDDITKLVGLSLTADALVYKYEINDSETGHELDSAMSFMKYITLSQMAQSIKNGIVGDRNKQFYKALIECGQGVECEYHELQTAKKASFRISTDEIQEVLNGKWDNQPSAKEWEDFATALEELGDLF